MGLPDRNHHCPPPRSVELAEEDTLPITEGEHSVLEGDGDGGADEGSFDVGV